MSKICTKKGCGYTNADSSHYCVMCGNPLGTSKYTVVNKYAYENTKSELRKVEAECKRLEAQINGFWWVKLKKWFGRNEWFWWLVVEIITIIGFIAIGDKVKFENIKGPIEWCLSLLWWLLLGATSLSPMFFMFGFSDEHPIIFIIIGFISLIGLACLIVCPFFRGIVPLSSPNIWIHFKLFMWAFFGIFFGMLSRR